MPGGNREGRTFNPANVIRARQTLSGPAPFTGGGITLPGVGSPFVAGGVSGSGLDEENEPLGRGRLFNKVRIDKREKASYGT